MNTLSTGTAPPPEHFDPVIPDSVGMGSDLYPNPNHPPHEHLEKLWVEVENRVIRDEVIYNHPRPGVYYDILNRAIKEYGAKEEDIAAEQLRDTLERVQAEQRTRLSEWMTYIEEQPAFSKWFKEYIWKSVLKAEFTINEKGKYYLKGRDYTSISQYPPLNKEALAYVHEAYEDMRSGKKPKLMGTTFNDHYAQALNLANPDLSKSDETERDRRRRLKPSVTNGSWQEYGSTETSEDLAGSLRGQRTGWEIAGQATASSYLEHGDKFMVYYSVDARATDGLEEHKVPRAAIRLNEEGHLQEVLISQDYGLENSPQLVKLLIKKLDGVPGAESYIENLNKLLRLGYIESRIHKLADTAQIIDEVSRPDIEAQIARLKSAMASPETRLKYIKQEATHLFRQLLKDQDPMHVGYIREGIASMVERFRTMSDEEAADMTEEWFERLRRVEKMGLTNDELRLVYELDGNMPVFGEEPQRLIEHIRKLHVDKLWEIDSQKLVERLLPEYVQKQLYGSLDVYEQVLEDIYNGKKWHKKLAQPIIRQLVKLDRRSSNSLLERFNRANHRWQEGEIYQHLAEKLKTGVHYRLVAAPNVRITKQQLMDLMKPARGRAEFDEKLFGRLGISDDQLSGFKLLAGPVRYSLVPNEVDPELSYRSAEEQRQGLQARQAGNSSLSEHVLNPFEAAVYQRVLAAQGINLSGHRAYQETITRSMVEPVKVLGEDAVIETFALNTYTDDTYLTTSRADAKRPIRVALG